MPSPYRIAAAVASVILWRGAQGQESRLDAPARRAVVDTIAGEFERIYVDADTGRLIAAHLRRRAAGGAYDAVTDPRRFADLLSVDVRAINDDHHLSVRFAPDAHVVPLGTGGVSFQAPDPEPTPAELDAERRAHYQLGKVDILRGNVGYLEIRGFSGLPAARDMIVAALRYLATTDAIIIDLRRNGGGDGALSNFVISHFTGPDSVWSLRVIDRSTHDTVDRWTMATVPGPRRPDVPLYLLTSRGSASAAEDFAFVLHNMGRATLVGDRTNGAGHNNVFVESGHGFVTSISFTRVMDPRSGREWEHVGVQPDIPVDPELALTVAHAAAVGSLAEHASGPRREELTLVREALDAERRPHAVPRATLARYPGQYESMAIALRDGHLTLQQHGGITDPLVPLSDSVFAVGANRLTFRHAAGGALELQVSTPNGERYTFARPSATR